MVVGKGCHLISQGHTHNICIFIEYLTISYTERQTVCLNLHYVPKCVSKSQSILICKDMCVCFAAWPDQWLNQIQWCKYNTAGLFTDMLQMQLSAKSRLYPELCVCKIGVWPQTCWHGRKIRASAEQHTQPIIHPPCNPEYLGQGWELFSHQM